MLSLRQWMEGRLRSWMKGQNDVLAHRQKLSGRSVWQSKTLLLNQVSSFPLNEMKFTTMQTSGVPGIILGMGYIATSSLIGRALTENDPGVPQGRRGHLFWTCSKTQPVHAVVRSIKVLIYEHASTVQFEDILPKEPYLPCLSMAGRALLAGYRQILNTSSSGPHDANMCQ